MHVSLEANATQAVGKALSLPNIISQLSTMFDKSSSTTSSSLTHSTSDGPATNSEPTAAESGMHDLDLSYTLGEQSELWTTIFGPLKAGRLPATAG